MEQNSSCETDNCSAGHETPRLLRNPNVHYRVHKSKQVIFILRQVSPVHIITLYKIKIVFRINLLFTRRSP